MHTVRIGTSKRKSSADDQELYRLPSRLTIDDGNQIFCLRHHQPVCTDCGVGTLRWAEAGFAPYHRICSRCGSHWELHPCDVFLHIEDGVWAPDWTPQHPWEIRHLLVADPEYLSIVNNAVNIARGVPYIPLCWAQRARFY